MKRFNLIMLLLLMTACGEEEQKYLESGTVLELETLGMDTRAYWSDDVATTGQAVFHWEANSNQLITALQAGGEFVRWGTDAEKRYTYTSIEPNGTDDAGAKLRTVNGIHAGDRAKVTATGGDAVYCLSPVHNEVTVSANASTLTATLPMPDKFPQEGMGQLGAEVFRRYAYIYAHTTVQTAGEQTLTGVPVRFNAAVAVIRFSITSSMAATVKSVSLSAMDSEETPQRIFPNQMRWTPCDAETSLSAPDELSDYYSTVTAQLNGDAGIAMAAGSTASCYLFVFPTSLTDRDLTITVTTEASTLQYHVKADILNQLQEGGFMAGRLYDFKLRLAENLSVGSIEVYRWGQNACDVQTQTLSLTVNPSVNVWKEKLLKASEVEFVDLGLTREIDGKSYKVLWATTNLGAKYPHELGTTLAWSEDDPVIEAYGLTGFNWKTPSKADFELLMDQCHSEFVHVMDAESQDHYGWRFYRKKEPGEGYSLPDPHIFLPAKSFMSDEDFNQSKCCYYWTCTAVADDNTKAYSFVTQINTSTNPHTAAFPADKVCGTELRVEQMPFRPVYLKPVTTPAP